MVAVLVTGALVVMVFPLATSQDQKVRAAYQAVTRASMPVLAIEWIRPTSARAT
jgi:hypothetical protein